MLRVLVVGKGPPDRGGIAAYLTSLLDSRLSQLHDLELLNLTRPGPPRGGRLDLRNLRSTAGDALAVWRASGDRDVVHIHSALAPGVTALRAGLLSFVARLRGAQVVLHAHGGRLRGWLTSPLRRWSLRVALASATVVAVVADSVAETLGEVVDTRRLIHLPNGVDLGRFHPAGGGPADRSVPRVLYVGLLTPRKGVLDLTRASRILTDRGLDHDLVLVGGTPDEGPEAERAVLDGIGSANLAGVRSHEEMPAVYADADIFCLPSHWEAMPLTVLEAMAAGLPVVATDVGDVAAVVEDGVTGTIVSPRDPGALADALAPFIQDASMRIEYGRAGRSRVELEYSSEVALDRLDQLYRRAAGGRR